MLKFMLLVMFFVVGCVAKEKPIKFYKPGRLQLELYCLKGVVYYHSYGSLTIAVNRNGKPLHCEE